MTLHTSAHQTRFMIMVWRFFMSLDFYNPGGLLHSRLCLQRAHRGTGISRVSAKEELWFELPARTRSTYVVVVIDVVAEK